MSLLRTMFWPTHSDIAELKKRITTLQEDLENAHETNSNLRSAVAQARLEAERMKLPHTEEGLELIASVTAQRVEDLFVTSRGGRDQRLRELTAILREVMQASLTGSTNYKGPGEPNYRLVPQQAAKENPTT